MALRFISQCFSAEGSEHIIDMALDKDVLTSLQIFLCSQDAQVIKETLWGISNITAGEKRHVDAFFAADILVERVISFLSSRLSGVKEEALWVINNAITSVDQEKLLQVFQKYTNKLVEPLFEALSAIQNIDLVMSTLQSI